MQANVDVQAEARRLLVDSGIRYGREVLARTLGKNPRTLTRWLNGTEIPDAEIVRFALLYLQQREIERSVADFQFADLFAGIGGTRLGFEASRGECVFTSEYDKHCQVTYRGNFAARNIPEHRINSDIREITGAGDGAIDELIPDHDVLVGGFPCQPFSAAGVSKKRSLGRPDGFACEAQGTLFFDVAQILRIKQPVAFLLENVKNLASHDGGRSIEVIMDTLMSQLGYHVYPCVVDARHLVPQHRERIFLVGFREEVGFNWESVNIPRDQEPRLGSILHPENGSEEPEAAYTLGRQAKVNSKYTLSDKLWSYLQGYAEKHRAQGNGFGFGLFGPDDVARTLSARYYKDGSEVLIRRGTSGRARPRRLTPRECSRLMGFPGNYRIPVSDTQAYKQFGNSVVVPVIEAIAQAMHPYVMQLKHNEPVDVLPMAI